MPEHAVLRLQDPMVLVREMQELARNAAALRSGKRTNALLERDAVIEIAVHDEDRRAPVLDVIDRIELLVSGRIFVLRLAAVLPFVEPELFSRIGHHAAVEHAIVRDDALPRIVPGAGDPVRHVAAVRRAERARAVTIEEAVLAQRGG